MSIKDVFGNEGGGAAPPSFPVYGVQTQPLDINKKYLMGIHSEVGNNEALIYNITDDVWEVERYGVSGMFSVHQNKCKSMLWQNRYFIQEETNQGTGWIAVADVNAAVAPVIPITGWELRLVDPNGGAFPYYTVTHFSDSRNEVLVFVRSAGTSIDVYSYPYAAFETKIQQKLDGTFPGPDLPTTFVGNITFNVTNNTYGSVIAEDTAGNIYYCGNSFYNDSKHIHSVDLTTLTTTQIGSWTAPLWEDVMHYYNGELWLLREDTDDHERFDIATGVTTVVVKPGHLSHPPGAYIPASIVDGVIYFGETQDASAPLPPSSPYVAPPVVGYTLTTYDIATGVWDTTTFDNITLVSCGGSR